MTQNIFRSNVSQSALIFILFLSFLFIMDRSLQGISTSSVVDNVSAIGSAVSETGATSTGAEVSQAQIDGISAQSALTAKTTGAEALAAKQKLDSAPAFFVQNKGQQEGGSLFYSTGSGYDFYVGKTSVTYAFSSKKAVADAGVVSSSSSSFELSINFAGANSDPVVTGANELNGKVNYLIGQDESKWQKNLSTYGGVTYQNLYSGIDLSYIGDATKIKYEFTVAPGANPSNIAMAYSGANGLKTDASGNLLIATPHGQLMDEKPTSYQMVNGTKVPVDTAFAVAGSTVGFKLGAYNTSLPLFVDPGIAYSTFLGGSGADEANDIYLDESTGDMYVTGGTTSDNFPVTADAGEGMAGPLDKRYNSGGDVFVSKFNASGDLVYSTFIGGSANDEGKGIKVNSLGQIVVAGETTSYNYPCPPGAYDRFYNGAGDAFVTILNPTGSSISKSTYFGSIDIEKVDALHLGASDEPIIVGNVLSAFDDTPFGYVSGTPGALEATPDNIGSAMILKMDSNISPTLKYLTYVKGFTMTDSAADNSDSVYLTGYSSENNFITTVGAYDTECGASGEDDCEGGRTDAVALKLSSLDASLEYATYLGGFGVDLGSAIAVNDVGNAFISGATDSCDFPETDPNDSDYFNNCMNGLFDEFLVELDDAGSGMVYFQRFGGTDLDGVFFDGDCDCYLPFDQFIDLDSDSNPVIVGYTQSEDFPITAGAIDNVKSEGSEVFISRIDVVNSILFDCCSGLDNSNLSYSTFFGWGFTPTINQITVDQNDVLHLTGSVSSSIYPTTINGFDQSQNGGQDAFVTKIDLINDFTPQVNAVVNPNSPDGENDWYKKQVNSVGELIPPDITLLSTGNGPSYYQWNSQAGNWTIYTEKFDPLPGENTLYFYGSDQSGATGDVFSFEIKWDPLDPGEPSLISTSHNISVPSNQQMISFDLGGDYLSVDPTSGIDHFNYKLGPVCDAEDDQVFTLSTSSQFFDTGIAPLSEGSYTLMLQAVDNAGNDGIVSCIGPYIVDITAPVSSLSKTPDPNDGHYDWYKSTPKITLSTEPGAKTFYKWDASYDNTGYYYATEDAQTIGTGGATLDIRGDDVADSLDLASVNLPFDFNYFGATYDRVYLSSNGLLTFDGLNTKHLNSESELHKIKGIAPLWDDLRTDGHATDDIYVATGDSWISFRWQARVYSIGDQEVNFEAVLYKDGSIRFNYGKQEGTLSATIGISNGDCTVAGDCIVLDGVTDTNMQNSKIFIPSKWETYDEPFDGKSGVHTLYYYSVDIAGNEENPLGSQIFKVDPDRPVGVTDLSSATHTIDTPTSVATIEAHWTAAVDPISGVDGYSVEWSTIDPVTYFKRGENHPDSSMDVNKDETATSDMFTATTNGSWYFYIRVKDNAGHWSPGDSLGPFVIDSGAGVPDTIKPDTFILSGPSGTIASSSATFTFTGTDNVTASGDLVYSAMLVGRDLTFDAYSSATSRTYTGLTNGVYTFKVRAKDTASPANNVDDTPAEQTFTVLSTESSVTVINTGTGSGTVRSVLDAGAAINCGVDCSETFPSSADISLFASADPGSYFFGWTGAAVSCGSNPSCAISIPINSAQTATATFKTIPIGATYDETSSGVVYQSSCWSNYSDAGFVGGTAKISKKKGCLVTLNFTGESVSLISAKSKQLGKAKIFIDGVLQTTVDLYSSSTQYQQVVYTSPSLTNGVHTMSIQVDGTKNASSTGTWVPIDAFTVFG